MKTNTSSNNTASLVSILAAILLPLSTMSAENGLVTVRPIGSDAKIEATSATDFHVETAGQTIPVEISAQPGWVLVSPSNGKGKVSNGTIVKYAVRAEDGEGSDGGDLHTCFFPVTGFDAHEKSPKLAKPFQWSCRVREQNPVNPTKIDAEMHFLARTSEEGEHSDGTRFHPCIWCGKLHDPVEEYSNPRKVDFNWYTWSWGFGISYLEIEYARNDFNPTIPMPRGTQKVDVNVKVKAVWTGCVPGKCEDHFSTNCPVVPFPL